MYILEVGHLNVLSQGVLCIFFTAQLGNHVFPTSYTALLVIRTLVYELSSVELA